VEAIVAGRNEAFGAMSHGPRSRSFLAENPKIPESLLNRENNREFGESAASSNYDSSVDFAEKEPLAAKNPVGRTGNFWLVTGNLVRVTGIEGNRPQAVQFAHAYFQILAAQRTRIRIQRRSSGDEGRDVGREVIGREQIARVPLS
jgi:hypothetical protein